MFLSSISSMNWKKSKSPSTPSSPDQPITSCPILVRSVTFPWVDLFWEHWLSLLLVWLFLRVKVICSIDQTQVNMFLDGRSQKGKTARNNFFTRFKEGNPAICSWEIWRRESGKKLLQYLSWECECLSFTLQEDHFLILALWWGIFTSATLEEEKNSCRGPNDVNWSVKCIRFVNDNGKMVHSI